METNGTTDGHRASEVAAGSANGARPETSESGWRAEQQLSRLLMKTQQRRERLAQVRGRLAAAKGDDESAWSALDQERTLSDAEDRRFGSLPWAFAIAIVVSIVDVLPAYWAAQALGNGVADTWLVTGILVGGLTGVAWMMSHYRNRRSRGPLLTALVFTFALILVEAFLRVRYLLVVNDLGTFDATLQGAVLAGISGVLVWVGYMKLVDAEPYATWKRRRSAHKASADLRKLQIEHERADTNYRAGSAGVATGVVRARKSQPEARSGDRGRARDDSSARAAALPVGDGQFPWCRPVAALGCCRGDGRVAPVRAIVLVVTVVLAAAAVSAAGAAGATGTPAPGTNVLVVMNPSKRAIKTEVRHVKEIFGQVSTLPGLRFFGIYEQRSTDDGPPFDRPFVTTQTPATAKLEPPDPCSETRGTAFQRGACRKKHEKTRAENAEQNRSLFARWRTDVTSQIDKAGRTTEESKRWDLPGALSRAGANLSVMSGQDCLVLLGGLAVQPPPTRVDL